MLLNVNAKSKRAERIAGTILKSFGLDERGLQEVLFQSLDRLLGDDELLLISQSRRGREEPDLRALDRDGNLFIFEIKLWEARSENLLQVLRYGQMDGILDYDDLNRIWQRARGDAESLREAHRSRFELTDKDEEVSFNTKQVFVVLTNGLDATTRQAIQYWRSTGLDVRPWIYRAYDIKGEFIIEVTPFRSTDNPLEDQVEGTRQNFYVVNTNLNNNAGDDAAMLRDRKAAAFYEPWKYKIERLKKGDCIFLYRSGEGIVGMGKADGKLKKASHRGHPNEEYSMSLDDFVEVSPTVPAAQMKEITRNPNLVFRQTMFGLAPEAGAALESFVRRQAKSR